MRVLLAGERKGEGGKGGWGTKKTGGGRRVEGKDG